MADAAGGAYDPTVITSSGLETDRVRDKLVGAVGYFEAEAASYDRAAVNARTKIDRLRAQIAATEGAVVEAETAAATALTNAESARTALAGLEP